MRTQCMPATGRSWPAILLTLKQGLSEQMRLLHCTVLAVNLPPLQQQQPQHPHKVHHSAAASAPVRRAGVHNLFPAAVHAAHHVLPAPHFVCLQLRPVPRWIPDSAVLYCCCGRCHLLGVGWRCIYCAVCCFPGRKPAIQHGHPAVYRAKQQA